MDAYEGSEEVGRFWGKLPVPVSLDYSRSGIFCKEAFLAPDNLPDSLREAA